MLIFISVALLAQILSVLGQNAIPTNSTLPAGLAVDSQLLCLYNDQYRALSPQYNVDFAVDASTGQKSGPIVAQGGRLRGKILYITPANISNLENHSIAYISCDSEVYSKGQLSLTDTIQNATNRISADRSNLGAIVLYSLYSAWCNYTATGSYNYKNVFIAPGQVPARTLEGLLRAASTLQVAEIYSGSTNRNGTAVGSDISSPSNGPNSNSNPSGGPSTTIAMIILYSVTAIITLCFVLVIVSGAIRARRHPERYGLLNLPIHAHQRRARGIARAMLETIPIVKFGEKEEMKLDSDLEQGTELGTAKQTDPPTQDVENVENVTLAKSKESVSKQEELPAVDPTSTETQIDGKVGVDTSDNSLACSVCTEDFVIGQDLRVLPCNHKFHPECIDPWLLNVSGTCPLCRIDLRPPEEKDEHSMNETGGTLNSIPSHTSNHPGSLTYQPPRFSVFLNRRRMGESTPAQRLRALRAVRNHNQNGEPVSNTTDAEGRETHGSASDLTDERTSRSNRVTRFFSRSESRVTTPSITALPTATTTATNTAEPSRNASSSNDQIPDVSSHH